MSKEHSGLASIANFIKRFWWLLPGVVMLVFIFYSARYPTDRDTLKVLYHAGPNALELIRTLDHFRNDPNPLKYKAASFLIRNMDLYYYRTDSFSDKKIEWASRHQEWDEGQLESGDDSLELEWKELKHNYKVKKVRDARHISSEFLIAHINQVFDLWQESPWSDHFDFDQFCEYRLPYKTNLAKPVLWIEDYRSRYEYILDSSGLIPSPSETAYRAWDTIQNKFRGYYLKLHRHLSPIEMENVLTGDCLILADWLGYIMKSIGLPVANIYTPKWANASGSHHWNAWMNDQGQWVEIMSRGETVKNWEYVPPKIFVRTGGKQHTSFRSIANRKSLKINDIPPTLRPWNVMDITDDIIPTANITINLRNDHPPNSNIVYLAVYNNMQWVPVQWSYFTDSKPAFRQMGLNALYLPVFFKNGTSIPAGNPFILNGQGLKMELVPDSNIHSVIVDRVYPLRYHVLNRYRKKMEFSKFEGSNDPAFSKVTTIFSVQPDSMTIPAYSPEMRGKWQYDIWWQEGKVRTPFGFRYIRYRSEADVPCEIGDVVLLGQSGEILQIKSTFGEGSNTEYVCDGVPGESYRCSIPGSWVAMDLGEPKIISRIKFIPRDIYPASIQKGDTYKLSVWEKDNWIPLFTVKAENKAIVCYLHEGKLYLLENLDQNVDSRPFIYNAAEDLIQWL